MSGAANVSVPVPTLSTAAISQLPAPLPCVWWSSTTWPAAKPVVEATLATVAPPPALRPPLRTVLSIIVPAGGLNAPSAPEPVMVTQHAPDLHVVDAGQTLPQL